MKRTVYFFLGILFTAFVACEDVATIDEPVDCVEVKLVYELCNQAVLQLLSPNTSGLELGTYEQDGVTYENVFKTFFHCEQMSQLPSDSTSFRIRPVSEEDWQNLIATERECSYCEPLVAGHLPFTHVQILENCTVSGAE